MHIANWYDYVCRVRRCKNIVTDHINTLIIVTTASITTYDIMATF